MYIDICALGEEAMAKADQDIKNITNPEEIKELLICM